MGDDWPEYAQALRVELMDAAAQERNPRSMPTDQEEIVPPEAPHPCPCTTSPCREAAMVTIKPGVWCDPCIAHLVAALNAWGIETAASCCGHREHMARISLRDGRELFLLPSFEAANEVYALVEQQLATERAE